MILRNTFLQYQKGLVLVLVALALIVLTGMAALAIDLSHAATHKTQLQNMADSLALSAAISLNKGTTTLQAQYDALGTLPRIMAAPGNSEITNTLLGFIAGSPPTASNLTFSFATDAIYQAGSTGIWAAPNSNVNDINETAGYTFVRVTMNNPMTVPTWFANIMGFSNVPVSVSAVAGLTPVVPCDNVLPAMVCAKNPSAYPAEAADKDCSDGDCFGYKVGAVYCLKTDATASPNCPDVPPDYTGLISGNFGWLDAGTGAKSIADCAAGDLACIKIFCANYLNNQTLTSQPGNAVSIAQGFNTRFDIYQGSYNNPGLYKPDRIVGDKATSDLAQNSTRSDGSTLNPAGPTVIVQDLTLPLQPSYDPYYGTRGYNGTGTKTGYEGLIATNKTSDATHPFQDGKRKMAVPFINCESVTKSGGVFTVPAGEVKGFGCMFLTQPMGKTGNDSNIYAELLDGGCLSEGTPTSALNTGVYTVQLYKDPFSGHS